MILWYGIWGEVSGWNELELGVGDVGGPVFLGELLGELLRGWVLLGDGLLDFGGRLGVGVGAGLLGDLLLFLRTFLGLGVLGWSLFDWRLDWFFLLLFLLLFLW